MPLEPIDLSVLIVTYNTADLIDALLDSIAVQKDARCEVFVVDNASEDDTVERIAAHRHPVRLIANRDNAGFARANNQAIAAAGGRYLYFLNPDTEVCPGAFSAALRYMDSRPEIGLAGTRILHPDRSVQASVEYAYPGQRHCKGRFESLAGEIAWVLGASMLARREAVEAVGGFDERYFLYAEDIDLCLRLRQAGWRIGFARDAAVVHLGGGSERKTRSVDLWTKKLRSEILFYRKFYPQSACRSIRRNNLLQAHWRLACLRAERSLFGSSARIEQKLQKYRAVVDVFGGAAD